MDELELERLGLERARVVAAASATEDFATSLGDTAGEIQPERAGPEEIASALTTAAALWMLVDVARARPIFRLAARYLDGLGSGDATILLICAGPRSDPVRFASDDLPARLVSAGGVLGRIWPVATGDVPPDAYRAGVADDPLLGGAPAGLPIGRLGIPLRIYLELGDEIASIRTGSVDPGLELRATWAFLQRVADATSVAMADRCHWRTLSSGLRPVEPEAVAASALVDLAVGEVLGTSLPRLLDRLRQWEPFASAALVAHDVVNDLDNPAPA